MQTILYVLKILYKKRWWLMCVPLAAAIIVFIILSLQPKIYKSETTIYTGIVSGYDVLSSTSGNTDWFSVNNAVDNLISIVKAESTLENVSLRLLARCLINMDVNNDNIYLTAESSKKLAIETPPEIFSLVVPSSEDSTFNRLMEFYQHDRTNYLQQLFHWEHRHYSYKALSTVEVARVSNSDMISISYQNDDQYIVHNTLVILVDEFIKQYIELRYEQTNDVVGYFEAELERIRRDLTNKENNLTSYNIRNQIINYEQQTKMVAERSKGLDISIEEVSMALFGARERIAVLEEKMGISAELFRKNARFIEKLHNITSLYTENSKTEDNIAKAEINDKLTSETDALRNISHEITSSRYTKEGLSAETMTTEWLNALLVEARAQAELEVLLQNRKDLFKEFERFSPVGSSIKRQNRDINFSEQNYLSNLQALNEAKLRQKNLQLTSATFKILSPPTIALSPEKTKNKLYTVICFLLIFVLLTVIEIIAEILNRKPYDKISGERITGTPVISAIPILEGSEFDDIYYEFAIDQLGNAIIGHLDRTKTNNTINILSMEEGEGKSFIAQGLVDFFVRLDTNPAFVSWNKDFDKESKYYLMASSIYDFAINEENESALNDANITIVEYPPLSSSSFPVKLLSSAAITIIVADTARAWKGMDTVLLKQLKEYDKSAHIFICLNGADIDAAGSFTGMLPPYNSKHRIRFKMWNLGSSPIAAE